MTSETDLSDASRPLEDVAERARREKAAYSQGEDRPLESYLAIMAAYVATLLGLGAVVRASGRSLPERFDARDLALLAVATHKASRLVTKDPVTSPLRAPFTRFAGRGADAEVAEEVRGSGMPHAVGEALTCPFCSGQWIATAGVFGLVLAPRVTRFVASIFATLGVSDALQHVYAELQQHGD